MRTLNEVLEDVKSDTTKIGIKPPKIQTLEDVKNTTFFSTSDIDNEVKNLAPVVESDLGNRISAGFDRGVQDLKNIADDLQIYGGQALMSIGGFFDSGELVSRGRELIKSAYGELQADEKKFWESSIQLSDKDLDSFGYGLGQGIANYGSMLAVGYLSPIAGIGLGTALEVGQKAEEKIGYHIEETGDTELNKYTSQKASKDTLYTAIYGAGSAILEKKFGLGEQLKLVKMPIGDKLKYIFKTSLSEGGTETLQELYATGLDLAGGYIDSSKLPERFMGAVKEGAIGAVLGGGMGVATAINHRSQAKAILRDNLKNTVPEKDLDNVVNGVYESVSDNMETVIAQELIQSESLRNKHGAIYESIKSEVSKQIKDTGAFADVDEMKLSQYIESTAKMFADQVLGEANKRKVVIDEVIKDSEIVYKDGKLYLQGATKKTKLKRLKSKTPSLLQFIRSKGGVIDEGGELKQMEASKQYIGLVNKNGIELDTMGEALWEAGYFAERPTVSEVLDYIDDELRGAKHYPLGYVEQKSVSQAENEAMLNDAISEYAEIMEYDISKMSYKEKQQIYDQMQRNLFASEEPIVEEEEVVEDFGFTDNEFFQVADEMARLDDIHPEYKGETISINGQEKTVYNSTGERIAKSKEALENFYNWFGDSKVVDEQGRPLVVYHGTNAEFDTFDIKKFGQSDVGYLGKGFYATNDFDMAESYADTEDGKVMPLYIKIQNPFIINDRDASFYPEVMREKLGVKTAKEITEKLVSEGYDGVVLQYAEDDGSMFNEIVAFEPNQIKSTSNRGTYSESDNIYYQSAFAGSRVDYDRPSLEAIGSGEGAQVHGWGLYYALNKDVAERYRETFKRDNVYEIEEVKEKIEELGKDEAFNYYKEKAEKAKLGQTLYPEMYELKVAEEEKYNMMAELVKTGGEGQVHEVDIPENPYLLDEQKTFNEQSEYVKERLVEVMEGLRQPNFKEKIFENKEEAYDFFDKKLEEYKSKGDGFERFHPKEFTTKNGEYGVKYVDDYTVIENFLENGNILGGGIYDRIVQIVGSKEQASQLLEIYGIKGITYEGRQDGRCFVIFNPDDVKVIQKFYQITNLPKQEKKIKGSFDALAKSIKITSEADFSTYQHEFAHFWLDNIWNYANSGVASEGYKKQFEGIKKWLGVKGNYLTREQHEKFARAYEKYLYKGTYANSPMGSVFSEYENFIRDVYDSIAEIDTRAGKKYKAIPKVVYDFFNSMTSGNLPYYGDIEEPEKEVKKEVKDVKEYVEEESKVLEENRANYTLKPVQTDTKTGYLTAYEKMTGQQVEAGAVNLEDELKKAQKFVNENPEQAKRIVEGMEQVPEGMLKNTIYIAYNDLQKRLGNTQNRVTSLLNQAMELRRMGQEIVSQKIAYADDTSPLYWIRTVQQNKIESLADSNGLSVKEINEKISNAIKAGVKEGVSAKDIAKELREELGVTELFQEEVYPTEDTDIKAYNYIYKYVNEQLGLGMSMEEAETITRKADDMLASLENSMSKTGNPSVDFFVKQKDLENYANSLAPSSNARVIVSVIGRGNLLTSIKSPLTNIISNFFVGAYRGAVRRVSLGVANSIVSPELIKQNKMYSWEIFRKTGYNVNNITPETPRNTILGEKLTHSEGEGNIRKLGRLYEEYIYKWSLGAGDVLFKDYAFTDYVALKATKLANGDVNKANALFKDASLIEPQTEEGKQIRQEAIDESLIATFQNKGAISEGALKARASIDFGVGFGEIIAPFVKTPANIVSMGLKAGFGGVRAIASEIKRDVKAGKILKPTQENIDLVVQNGLGLLLASMLINAVDDDDYMPPYALATSKDKQLAKELNIPFNAVKIGNTWFSLDYLGALASPLVGLLQARREEGFLNNIYGYSKSAGVQALSIPAFGNISDLFEKIQNLVRKSGDEVMSETGQDLLEQAYARVVPSIVSDVAKALDPYERETQGNEFITKIPVLRETAPKKVSVTSGEAEELGSPIYDLLFGSRVKEQVTNDVADELQRLNNVGYGVSLTTVTRSGLLSELDEDTKQKVREDFAEEYSKQVKRLIKTSRYKRLSDEDKMESVNKVRRSIIEKLKKRYLKKRKK